MLHGSYDFCNYSTSATYGRQERESGKQMAVRRREENTRVSSESKRNVDFLLNLKKSQRNRDLILNLKES